MNKIELTPKEIEAILEYNIKNNIDLANRGEMPITLCITGEAGISKTSIVKQVGANLGGTHNVVRLNPQELMVEDLIGFPITEFEICHPSDNICKWVSKEVLNDFITSGFKATGEHRMSYAIPEWIQGKQDKPVLLILDDLTRAQNMVLQAMYRILDEQGFASWSLPKGSSIICTTNPDNGEYIISTVDDAFNSRYLQLYMKADVESWEYWATQHVQERFINFLSKHKEVIEGVELNKDGTPFKKGNLRSWTKFFFAISGISDLKGLWHTIALPLGSGTLPKEHLIMFNQYLQHKYDEIPTAIDILKSTDIQKVIDETKKLCKNRQDISSLITKRLYNYALHNYQEYTPLMISNYIKLLESDLLSKDLVFLNCKNLSQTKYNKVFELTKSPIILQKLIG